MESKQTTTVLVGVAGVVGFPALVLILILFFFVPAISGGAGGAQLASCGGGGQLPAPGGGGGTVRPVDDIHTSSGFGPRGGEYHRGVDLPSNGLGSPIYAYAKGVVADAGPASGFGQWIVLDHTIHGKKISTVYGHMYPKDLLVSKGDRVKAGQQIARIGSNGHSTGPHLHFEYWVGGRFGGHPIDPYPYVQAARPAKSPQAAGPQTQAVSAEHPAGNDGGSGTFPLPKPDGPGRQSGHAGPIPVNYLAAYKAAGKRFGVPWQLLAGVGWAETRHGQSNAPGVHSGENGAGAGGPMQFLQGTWNQYGIDGNGDGLKNRYDIADAAFGAANYLVASGAKKGTQGVWDSLYAYNHAHWYANDVLGYAWEYATGKIVVTAGSGPGGQCTPGGVLRAGGDASHGTHGANPKNLRLNWPDEKATVDDPTTNGNITPRMKKLLDALKRAPAKPASKGCWRPADQFPDHPGGYACDLMFTPANTKKNINAGWALANWLVANQKVLAVKYVIWQGKIWTADREPQHWRPYTVNGCPDPAQVTVCHYDHVHVTVY